MEAQRKVLGLSEGGRPTKTGLSKNPVITLAEIGVDKNLAHQARKFAALPEAKFEALVERYEEQPSRSHRKKQRTCLLLNRFLQC
jgi:hypothetical protein